MTNPQLEKTRALNEDHHRRMASDAGGRMAGENERICDLDRQSRFAILTNMIKAVPTTVSLAGRKLNVLELGSGYCGDVETLEQKLGTDLLSTIRYVGVEVVPHVVDSARIKHPHLGMHCTIWEQAAEWWPGRFDFIYSRHVMEHALDANAACKAIATLLAPNGVAGAVTPHYFPDPEPAHVTQLECHQWMQLYQNAGLEVCYGAVHGYNCEEAHIVVRKR